MRLKPAILGLAVWLLAAVPALAIQQRNIENVLPRGGARGTTVEVIIQGMDINEPEEVLFYRPGITAEGFEVLPHLDGIHGFHGSRTTDQFKVRFKIAADCPIGEHPFRVRTATTLTTLATFWVTPYPIVAESEKSLSDNDTLIKAQNITLNTTVSGKIHGGAKIDRDLYRVELLAGERMGVEVDFLRLSMMSYGDAEYDIMTLVLDDKGRELARSDDTALHVQDPLMSFVAPATGAYYVEVRQRLFKPFQPSYYHAHIGNFTRPDAAYPLGGPAGENVAVRFIGDAAGDFSQSVAIAGEPGMMEFFPGPAGQTPPSALTLRSCPYGNTLEAEPNDEPAKANSSPAAPQGLNGILQEPGDVDFFRLPLTKGNAYRVRVYSRSIGMPVDSKITLRPAAKPDEVELEYDDTPPREREFSRRRTTCAPRISSTRR